MPTLELTTEQVLDLVRQLPARAKDDAVRQIVAERMPNWTRLSEGMEDAVRMAARERQRDWNSMTEEEQDDFIQELCEED